VYEAPLDGIKRLRRARMYGLLSDSAFVAPWQRSWMTALFGLQEVHVPRHGHHDLAVDVVFSKFYGGERSRKHRGVDLLRQGVWAHHLRNRRVAALFRALADEDGDTLEQKFADVARRVEGRLGGRVGLLVEGVEHASALARLLPGVAVIAGSDVWTEGLSDGQVKLLKPAKKSKNRNCAIVTATGLAHTKRFDVLVRADGGVGLPALPEAHRVIANEDDGRMLLIDFTDEHHPALAWRSRQRRNTYSAAGWSILGRSAAGAMDRFVAQRPEVC
jgi:hypothetical protein